MEKKRSVIIALFVGISFLTGMAGYMKTGAFSPSDSVYHTIQLFALDCQAEGQHMNLLLEIARWLAPISVASFVIFAFHTVYERLRVRVLVLNGNASVIHGDSSHISTLSDSMKGKVVVSDESTSFRARNQILMFKKDEDLYEYIEKHLEELLAPPVSTLYLCSETLHRGSYENEQIIVSNIPENTSRLYWEEYPLKDDRAKILLIGMGKYGKALLTQALLVNVLSDCSAIEYHVVGDYREYLRDHRKLSKALRLFVQDDEGQFVPLQEENVSYEMEDCIYFYDKPWQDVLSTNTDFERVILTEDDSETNIVIMNDILMYYYTRKCFVRCNDRYIVDNLWHTGKSVIPFGTGAELYSEDIIMKESLFRKARTIHARYFCNYLCNRKEECPLYDSHGKLPLHKCIECPHFIKDWNKLSTFLRYSNAAQADHMGTKIRILLGQDADLTKEGIGEGAVEVYRSLPEEEQKRLWAIEHIRWSRYHYLNNWDYAPVRDNEKHLHHLLRPFQELSYEEQKKDGDAWLSLDNLI